VLGDLYDEISPTIPLHHATRTHAARKVKRQETVESMRDNCLRATLVGYPLRWSVETKNGGIQLPRSATLTPLSRACAECGKPFFALMRIVHCSLRCAAVRNRRLRKHALRAAPQPENVARLIIRIDRAMDELEQIKDELLMMSGPHLIKDEMAAD
jgi:hypothetical protein